MIADQLRQAIATHPGSRYALARAAGINPSALARFAKGRGLGLDAAGRLAHALGLVLAPAGKAVIPAVDTPSHRTERLLDVESTNRRTVLVDTAPTPTTPTDAQSRARAIQERHRLDNERRLASMGRK